MSSLDDLTDRFVSTVQIILSNPQGEVIECKNQETKEAGGSSSEDLSESLDFQSMSQSRAQSLPDIHELQLKGAAGRSPPKIEDYFYKWRCLVEKRRSSNFNYSGNTGEWTQKPTSPVSLGKMAEGFHKRNSVLEDSFMMEYNWSARNKSTSY